MPTKSPPAVLDPATGLPLPPMLSVEQVAELWPMHYETARKRISGGDWVSYQQEGQRGPIRVPARELARVRQLALKGPGKSSRPAKRSNRRR